MKIERIKTSKLKNNFQLLMEKGDPLSPLVKLSKHKEEIKEKVQDFKNLIFNPDKKKEELKKHLQEVHQSLIYGLRQLKRPAGGTLHSTLIKLNEAKSKTQFKFLFKVIL